MIITYKVAVFLLQIGHFSEGAPMHTNLPSSVIKTRTTNFLNHSWRALWRIRRCMGIGVRKGVWVKGKKGKE